MNNKENEGNIVRSFYTKHPFPNDNIKSEKELEHHAWILNSIPENRKPNGRCTIADIGCGTGGVYLLFK